MENEAEVIKSQMVDTRTALTEKLEAMEQLVTDKVKDTTEAVADTVQTVKEAVETTATTLADSVHDTVEAVKETFNLRLQVEKHPWAMLGSAVALGYVGGALLGPAATAVRQAATALNGHGGQPSTSPVVSRGYTPVREEPGPAWGGRLAESLSPALTKLRELVVGAAAELLGEMILEATPENLRQDVSEVIDSFTTGLGGKPVHLFEPHHNGHHEVAAS
jgi:ElaB/YqjD/DUF883 family membrane-anchored ribosome-binding protein